MDQKIGNPNISQQAKSFMIFDENVTIYPPVNKHSNGKSPSWIGNTSSNGGFSIAMLDYRSVSSFLQNKTTFKWRTRSLTTKTIVKALSVGPVLRAPRQPDPPNHLAPANWGPADPIGSMQTSKTAIVPKKPWHLYIQVFSKMFVFDANLQPSKASKHPF